MARKPDNTGKRWSDAEVMQLQKLADQNTPTRVINPKLDRTEDAAGSKMRPDRRPPRRGFSPADE